MGDGKETRVAFSKESDNNSRRDLFSESKD